MDDRGPYYVMHGAATLHGPLDYDAAEHWAYVEEEARGHGVSLVDERERAAILAGDRLPDEKIEMFDALRAMVGDGQAVIWWSPEARSFAVRVLQQGERVAPEPTGLVKQVQALEAGMMRVVDAPLQYPDALTHG